MCDTSATADVVRVVLTRKRTENENRLFCSTSTPKKKPKLFICYFFLLHFCFKSPWELWKSNVKSLFHSQSRYRYVRGAIGFYVMVRTLNDKVSGPDRTSIDVLESWSLHNVASSKLMKNNNLICDEVKKTSWRSRAQKANIMEKLKSARETTVKIKNTSNESRNFFNHHLMVSSWWILDDG